MKNNSSAKYYCVQVDGKLASNCQKDPLVYFRRRDALNHLSNLMPFTLSKFTSRTCYMKVHKIKIVRARIEVEK